MAIVKGDIVLIPFPFTDLSSTKLRPAVILSVDNQGNDITVCFISSQNISNLRSDEFLIDSKDPSFSTTGLKISSKVRVSRIVTIDRRLLTRRIGKLESDYIEKLNQILIAIFQL